MPPSDQDQPTLTGPWVAGACALIAGALTLAAGGFVNSFSAVRDAIEPSFGDLAWTVPVLIDVGIAVFSGIDLLFTRLDLRIPWLRLVPWTLNGATIWLNIADEHTSVGVVAHAAPPILWIVTIELAGHFLRARSGLERTPETRRQAGQLDRVRLSRWLMAPWSTWVIRRWMILQDERSFDAAYTRWWSRKQAKWQLQDQYGTLLWRLKAPRHLRGRYRYGHLTPSTDGAGPACETGPVPLAKQSDRPAMRAPRRVDRREVLPRRRRAGLHEVRSVVHQLSAEGSPVNRTIVTQRLRAQGLSLSNERADRFLDELTNSAEVT